MANKPDNRTVYSQPEVVEFYAARDDLFPAERYLFDKYLTPGRDVLDVGVGGGRTTPRLAETARKYLGIDFSAAMVAACRVRFPDRQFVVADATDLADIPDDSFDFTVFSFNGIDYLPSDESRMRSLQELSRVTRKGGHVVFSSHNARAIGALPQLRDATARQIVWRAGRSILQIIRGAVANLTKPVFWRGGGYVLDPVHGGLFTHVSTPASVELECSEAGLDLLETVGHYHPRVSPAWLNPWYYYVFRPAE